MTPRLRGTICWIDLECGHRIAGAEVITGELIGRISSQVMPVPFSKRCALHVGNYPEDGMEWGWAVVTRTCNDGCLRVVKFWIYGVLVICTVCRLRR
jgi:hypothetical protein